MFLVLLTCGVTFPKLHIFHMLFHIYYLYKYILSYILFIYIYTTYVITCARFLSKSNLATGEDNGRNEMLTLNKEMKLEYLYKVSTLRVS